MKNSGLLFRHRAVQCFARVSTEIASTDAVADKLLGGACPSRQIALAMPEVAGIHYGLFRGRGEAEATGPEDLFSEHG